MGSGRPVFSPLPPTGHGGSESGGRRVETTMSRELGKFSSEAKVKLDKALSALACSQCVHGSIGSSAVFAASLRSDAALAEAPDDLVVPRFSTASRQFDRMSSRSHFSSVGSLPVFRHRRIAEPSAGIFR